MNILIYIQGAFNDRRWSFVDKAPNRHIQDLVDKAMTNGTGRSSHHDSCGVDVYVSLLTSETTNKEN